MMGNFYLSIDVNEKEGRHILGWLENGRMKLEQVHRFEIKYMEKDDKRVLDLKHIFEQIKAGIARCRKLGKLPVLVGLTACDGYFVLLDDEDRIIGDMVFCPDDFASLEDLRSRYGGYIEKCASFLMLSDYLNFMLTGRKQCEFTSLPRKLVNTDNTDWDEEYINHLGLDRNRLAPIARPGYVVGNLTLQVTDEVGYDFIIIQAASRKACEGLAVLPDIQNNCKKEGKTGDKTDEALDQQHGGIIYNELKASIGCLCILLITSHELKDIEAAKECIRNTFINV